MIKETSKKIIDETILRYPKLKGLEHKIVSAIELMKKPNIKIMICGNGGSSSDGEHIVGELMKEFILKREIDSNFKDKFTSLFPNDLLYKKLQGSIPAINISSQTAILTATINDIGADYSYAQQVYGFCNVCDVLIAISTSGNAENVLNAAKVAIAKGGVVLALTGESGGKLRDMATVLINVPETETFKVQELHLPIYHLLCRCLENEYWGS